MRSTTATALECADCGREEWLDAVITRILHQLGWSDATLPTLPPLDVAATAFQWRVWDALTRIPTGTTLSYGQLAAQLGQPRAARAVGRACGSNRLALIVPCHRIVREDGSLGGWRWGVERKPPAAGTRTTRRPASGRERKPSPPSTSSRIIRNCPPELPSCPNPPPAPPTRGVACVILRS